MQTVLFAIFRARDRAGVRIAMSSPMIAMDTSNSINVNARDDIGMCSPMVNDLVHHLYPNASVHSITIAGQFRVYSA
jgi:hypothetical protein